MIGWRGALSDSERAHVRDVIDAAEKHDGVAPVGDGVLRELARERTRHLLAVEPEHGESLVGYLNLVPATADAPAMAEAVVHPEARRRGIGSELIRTGLAAGGDGARIWAHGNKDGARGLAAVLGLNSVRELVQMRRSVADLPDVTVAPGIGLRTYAGPADDDELLRVNNAAFAGHPEQGGWTASDFAERRAEPWFDADGLFLAFDDPATRLLGFHWTKVHGPRLGGLERSDSGGGLGEVYVVGVDPDARGRGLGATLTLAGLHYLAARLGPSATVMLYVEADNGPALHTYRQLGFEVSNTDVAYTDVAYTFR